MRKPHPHHGTEDDSRPIGRLEHTRRRKLITDRPLHPAVVDHDPKGRERRSERHHDAGEKVEPLRHPSPSEHQHAEKAGLKREGGEALIKKQRSLNGASPAGKLTPVGTELERHDDARNDAHAEGDGKDPAPEIKKTSIDRPTSSKPPRLQNAEPRGEPYREGWENDVEGNRSCKLNAGQQ
jgi:hypothetical protein